MRTIQLALGLGLILATSSPAWSQQGTHDQGQANLNNSPVAEPDGVPPAADSPTGQKPNVSSGTPVTPSEEQPAAVVKTKTKSNQSND